MDEELKNIFIQKGLRLTKPRIDVFNVLKNATTPLSIVAIAKACPTIDKTSAYRTVALFNELQIISTVPQGWKQLYELASPFKLHHHHLICEQCGRLTEIHSPKVEELIAQLAQESNFTPSAHHFEITGRCQNCTKKDA